MTIQVGDTLPNIPLKRLGENGLEDFSFAEYIKGKRIVLFGIPGAFTPACAAKHLPGYVAKAEAIKAKGIDEIISIGVNDPFVLKAFGEQAGATGKVTMLPDWKAELVTELGLTLDASAAGLGIRSQRFSMFVDNGVVYDLQIEPVATEVELSSADACLTKLAA